MAVFRVPKNKDYTVMANHHLRDKRLSLKAKGLLSLMLSLPEGWDYTLRGLSFICRDGVDSINAAVKELQDGGYIERRHVRNEKGHFTHYEYTILEKPEAERPEPGKPELEKPELEKPYTENPVQLNTNRLNTKELNKDLLNTNPSNQKREEEKGLQETSPEPADQSDGMDGIDEREAYRELFKRNIDYDILLQSNPYSQSQIDGFIELMLDIVNCRSPTIVIGGSEIPAEVVKSRLLKLDMGHIQYVLDSLQKNTTKISNIRKYLLAALYNAPSTIDSYYVNRVNYDSRQHEGRTQYDHHGGAKDYSFEPGESF